MSATTPQSILISAMTGLFETGRFSDLIIQCQRRRYPVHKVLLCTQSSFFDGACNGHFLESKSGQIDLSDEDEEVVEHMIHYFYHLDYSVDYEEHRRKETPTPCGIHHIHEPLQASADCISSPTQCPPTPRTEPYSRHAARSRSPKSLSRRLSGYRRRSRGSSSASNVSGASTTPSSIDLEVVQSTCCKTTPADHSPGTMEVEGGMLVEEEAPSEILLHARIYAVAEKYGIPGLKIVSKRKFETLLFPSHDTWDRSPLSNAEVRKHFMEEEFPAVLREVYVSTIDSDRGLRNVVVQAFRARPELGWKPKVQQVIKDLPDLAWDLYSISMGMPLPN